jgi:3-hydroxyacyl-[acyl-carrier-protein] dehydratase
MDRVDIVIPRDHPSAAGHFPGNPIVPGALLLSEVIHAWESLIGTSAVTITIKVAKFLSPTRPGDTVSISFERLKPATVKFTCAVKDTPVLSGSFDYGVADPPR